MAVHHRRRLTVLLAAAAAIAFPAPAIAHVTEQAGSLEVTLGWGNEPPLVGLENSVEVVVADDAGSPVGDAGDELEAEVTFGDRQISLPLEPGEGEGEFAAALVPTRPGTYAFHVTGRVGGQPIDIEATCSDGTFECVAPASEAQFPVADPSAGELAQALEREAPRVEEAGDTADGARTLSIVALVIAAVALGAAGAGLVVRRKSG